MAIHSLLRRTQHRHLSLIAGLALCLFFLGSFARASPGDYFRINVVDADTNRGVPLVELKTTNEVRYYSDSNGIVAIGDPELLGQKVYFLVKSHGYEVPADGFGNRGVAFDVVAGRQATIRIKRLNIAERLYRTTGAGIYRDSVLVGAPVPLQHPLINGLVMGQDTVGAAIYKGKLFWLWGDTNRPAYPLGNFSTSSATSLLPGRGGLNPDQGVDFSYFVNNEGFVKGMMPMPGSHPVWMGGLFSLPDDQNQERLFGSYSQVESDSKSLETGLAVFDDKQQKFDKVRSFAGRSIPGDHPFQAFVNGRRYLYFNALLRTPADYGHILNPAGFEAYTCLAPGASFQGADTRLDRDGAGRLVFGWKVNTSPLSSGEERALIRAKKMAPEEALLGFRDVESGDSIEQVSGSVFWNAFRHRWVRILGQVGGSSYLGEIWFSEADTPTGPWAYARKIVTHDHYTFYNPTQHPFFDQDGGRLIYFEGTYTTTYSGNSDATPRYNYNQIMYRLALDDPRLVLPVPIYRLKNGTYAAREELGSNPSWSQVQSLPFFGMPSAGDGKSGLIPVYALSSPDGRAQLSVEPPVMARTILPLFYALPLTHEQKPGSPLVPLYEHRGTRPGDRFYSTEGGADAKPLALVWRNPSTILPLDDALPAPAEGSAAPVTR